MAEPATNGTKREREHPAEGLKREDITITDIKVIPFSYVHDGEYLWRCGGLYVWKADAALVQIFTNQGLVGIAEGSPYRGPDKLKAYTDSRQSSTSCARCLRI